MMMVRTMEGKSLQSRSLGALGPDGGRPLLASKQRRAVSAFAGCKGWRRMIWGYKITTRSRI